MDIVWYLLGKKAGGGGGSPVIPPEAGTLLNIVVGTLPKTSYIEGEPLDLTGCVIYGNYSNGGQYDVTSGCTFIANNPVLYTDTKIVVTYETATLDIPITVAGRPVKAPASTVVLYHLDGNTNNAVPGGTAAETTSTSYRAGKFGQGMYGVEASGKKIVCNDFNKNATEISTGSWTIEMWQSANNSTNITSNFLGRLQMKYNSSGYDSLLSNQSNQVWLSSAYKVNGSEVYHRTLDASVWTINTFHHIAISAQDGTYRIFIDGKLYTSGSLTTTRTMNILAVGGFNGWFTFDEIMACNECKYVADFEPPHAPYYIEE